MKKHIPLLAAATLLCVLFGVSCKHESEDGPHTDPAFLRGTWSSAKTNFYTFTIEADLSFECVLNTDAIYAKITGKLDADASSLGPNDYLLRNLAKLQTIDDATHPGNPTVEPGLASMNNITVVTLKPNGNKTRFTFTSANPTANLFFGNDGDFVKQ
jgi:hypothetical protein